MSRTLSFYFDGVTVQAVIVRQRGSAVALQDARTFPFDELPQYLADCRFSRCIICSNPPQFHQDLLEFPPAARKHYDTLIRNELAVRHPELSDYTFFYEIVGETVIETKPYNRIAVFSYPDTFLYEFICELNRHGMAVAQVYAAPLVLTRLAATASDMIENQPRLLIAALPGEKQLLLCENHRLEFVRKLPTQSNALLLEDAANINMTIDYCFQALRLHPAEAVLVAPPEQAVVTSGFIAIPLRSSRPELLHALPGSTASDYLAPLAAALHAVRSPRDAAIVPSDYRAFSRQKRLLTVLGSVMAVALLLCSVLLFNEYRATDELSTAGAKIRSELSGSASELATFKKLDAEISKLKEPLEFVNKHNSSLNPAAALAALAIPIAPEYTVKSVAVQKSDTAITVQIDGIIIADGYSDTQKGYEKLLALVKTLPGYSVISGKVDIKQKSFSIQTGYNGNKASGT